MNNAERDEELLDLIDTYRNADWPEDEKVKLQAIYDFVSRVTQEAVAKGRKQAIQAMRECGPPPYARDDRSWAQAALITETVEHLEAAFPSPSQRTPDHGS